MSDVTFGFTCECGEELEAEIVVDYGGSRGSYWSPPEGAEWHLKSDVVCTDYEPAYGLAGGKGCGRTYDDEWFADHHEDAIQQLIAEPRDDY